MKKSLFILFLMLCAGLKAQTQKPLTLQETYNAAVDYYQSGQFDLANKYANDLSESSNSMFRIGAYRILALCALENGNDSKAQDYVESLLKADPYYTPSLSDPRRFRDMIETSKSRGAGTITTASKQKETLAEVPVPVTLITSEMIENSGARTLKEVLCTYVPGMTNVETNEETNMAMRGLYSTSQEVLLIMLNGHRLNSYSTNAARPDFSISLDKVEQIEVLRGPASSLYGGVALAGVVNIITKTGSSQDGLSAGVMTGNHGQMKGNFLLGKRFVNSDFMAWATVYNAKGEVVDIPYIEQMSIFPCETSTYIDGYNNRPTYDYGFTLNYEGFSLLFNNSFCKRVAQYALTTAPYSYNDYGLINNNKPGFFNRTTRLNLGYSHDFSKNFSIKVDFTYDDEEHNRYQIAGDNFGVFQVKVPVIGTEGDSLYIGDYAFQNASWQDRTLGGSVQAYYSYEKGIHKGDFIAGIQSFSAEVTGSSYVEGDNLSSILVTYPEDVKGLMKGRENSFNVFMQYKHAINRRWIINAGIRRDHKKRRLGKDIVEWSPRMSLIYTNHGWNAKLSYSKSFVDASYFYRINTFDTTVGNPDLDSEYQYSWQATIGKNFSDKFFLELSGFRNNTTNIVIPKGFRYVNAGSFCNTGLELVATYRTKKWDLHAQAFWQKMLSQEEYNASDNYVYNMPNITMNIVGTYHINKNLRLSTHLNMLGEQTTYYQMVLDTDEYINQYLDIPFHVLWNMNASYTLGRFTFKADCHNIIGKHYYQGAFTTPLMQQGRWISCGVSFKI